MTNFLIENGNMAAIVFRATILLVLTTLATLLLRRRPPAFVHRVWTLGLMGCLFLPWIVFTFPETSLPVLPFRLAARPTDDAAKPSDNPIERAFIVTPDSRSVRFAKQNEGRHRAPTLSQQERTLSQTPPSATDDLTSSSKEASQSRNVETPLRQSLKENGTYFEAGVFGPLTQGFALVWGLGILVSLLGFVRQMKRTRGVTKACAEVTDVSIEQTLAEVISRVGASRSVSVRIHEESISPMVIGSFRPVIVLPKIAAQWSRQRLTQVLFHELYHIQRRDVLTQAIARFTCAVFWFQPLVWWGAREMRRLRELACDDLVVMTDGRADQYAETLLEIAKLQRLRLQAFSVAMARLHQVESRIRLILDPKRRRVRMTKRVSLGLLGCMCLLISLTGTLQLTARANAASPLQEAFAESKKEDAGDNEEVNSETRQMQVSVLDEEGQPVSGASLLVNVSEVERTGNFPTQTYVTDELGNVEVLLPRRIRILRLWPSKPGYVTQFMNFAKGKHEEGRLIPDTFEFRLQKGSRLSGTVLSEKGEPIEGAKVELSVDVSEPPWTSSSVPIVSRWLANGGSAVTTDKDGRWEFTDAPRSTQGDHHRFEMMVKHPSYVGDSHWGELQDKQGVTTEQLRAGTAKIVLPRGTAVQGNITGPDGQPITQGLVIWSDNPYFSTGTFETRIQENGTYSTHQLAPGEYPITVLAPGYSPDRKVVQVNESMKAVHFQLKPGNRVELKIVDREGNVIPKARVQIGLWRGTEAMYNHIHSSVPSTGIPTHADDKGIYQWSWAPEDAVQYSVQAAGFDAKEIFLIAKEEAHRVVLPALTRIHGKVLDAETRQPIDRFQVVPVKAFRPDFYSTNFQDPVLGKNGQYEIKINSFGQKGNRYRVRISADGYRTALGTKSLEVGDPALEEDFLLQRVPALVGMVRAPDGKAEKNYVVAVGTATTAPHFELDRPRNDFGVSIKVRDQYPFELPATFETRRIRVYNESGFAEVLREPKDDIGIIQLQPWAKVSGRLMNGERPIANEFVYFYPIVRRGLKEPRFQDSFAVKTNLQGFFEFQRLPPMPGYIRPYLGPWQDSPMTSAESVPLNLQPGKTHNILLGGNGATIQGTVVAKGRKNQELSKNWSLNYLINRDHGVSYPVDDNPLEFDSDASLDRKQLSHPDFSRWLATRSHHFIKLSDDGNLTVHGVQPGNYELVIQLYEQPAGCLVETIGRSVVPVTIPRDASDGFVLDLGTIEVECRSGPRVGSDMRSFEFANADRQLQSVNDSGGRHVLMHVWASWCQPCMASMPRVKTTHDGLDPAKIQFVGLNIDADKERARSLVQKGDWSWAQNYLGEDSDLIRQLAVSSAPAYFLIGPDGKLVASANHWDEIRPAIEDSVNP